MTLAAAAKLDESADGASLADFLSLTKPRITALVLCTTATGLFLAPGHLGAARLVIALLGTALVVGGANALNCYVERGSDRQMLRTRDRALAAGRIAPSDGLMLALVLSLISVPLLSFALNPLTGLLALVALVSYAWIYTPLKRITPKALLVGAVPGAIPPLLGWTAVTGRLDPMGLCLFGVMFLWQLPHFLAITLYLKDDYARGGHQVLPLVRGEGNARWQLLGWTLVLVPASLSFLLLKQAGWPYAAVALLAGAGFLLFAVRGVSAADGPETQRAARQTFVYSIVYLLVLFGALLADHRSPRVGVTPPAVAGLQRTR